MNPQVCPICANNVHTINGVIELHPHSLGLPCPMSGQTIR